MITPVITLSLVLLSISYSPWFSWSENALSDLGVHEAAVLFNSSLMISGILTFVFALGLVLVLRQSPIGLVGVFALILAAVSLFAIGLFPETAGDIHFYVSVSFFTFGTLSMLILGVALVRQSSGKSVGAFSILAGLFSAAVWIVFLNLPHKGVAIPEMLSSLATSAWSIIMGARFFKQSSKT